VRPYEAVATALDPDRTLNEFLETTYRAAADGKSAVSEGYLR
jgi:hypothetical protein